MATFPPRPEPLVAQFPEYADVAGDAAWGRLRIEHALTMTMGIDWNEDAPYTSEENSEIAMELAPDRHRYIFERAIVEEPGSRWRYCGGASALVGRLISSGAQQPLEAFARDVLFEPLGIGSFEWTAGHDGVASAASGLRLAPRDLARIGETVLREGRWDGREVVPENWLGEALRSHVSIAPGFEYGYQWYLGAFGTAPPSVRWKGGIGNGGQRLLIVPELDLVVALTAGNYDGDQSITPRTVVDELILPAIER